MVAHLIPSATRGGRKREVDMREVFNGVMDVLSTGCQGRYIPKDLPAKSTLYALQFAQAQQIARIIGTILRRFHGDLLILTRECGKLQSLEMSTRVRSGSVCRSYRSGNVRARSETAFRLVPRRVAEAPIVDFAGWIAKALTGREHQSSSSQAGANCAKHPVGLRAKGLSARRE
jgi:transposase